MTIKREIDAVVVSFYCFVGQETCLIGRKCSCHVSFVFVK